MNKQYCQARQWGWKGFGKLGFKGCSKEAVGHCSQCKERRCQAHLFKDTCVECYAANALVQEDKMFVS